MHIRIHLSEYAHRHIHDYTGTTLHTHTLTRLNFHTCCSVCLIFMLFVFIPETVDVLPT